MRPFQSKNQSRKNDSVNIPIMQVPSFRTAIAIENGVERNILIKTWGGIGDQICAEPTIRYAVNNFKDCKISLASEYPEMFGHILFEKVYDLKKEKVDEDKYFVFNTIVSPENLTWEFFSHCLTNCVDFPSMCAFRSQLPVDDREILISPTAPLKGVQSLLDIRSCLVHAGKHWDTKTFPKDWWDAVLVGLQMEGITPILIGADADDNRGTVNVNTTGCIDMRNELSINDSIWLCQRAKVILTNDSSPLHMSASRDPNDVESGLTYIGYVATCKHPDYISHFRRPVYNGEPHESVHWNWREKNLGVGGIWEGLDHLPNKKQEVTVDKCTEEQLRSWLPKPEVLVQFAAERT